MTVDAAGRWKLPHVKELGQDVDAENPVSCKGWSVCVCVSEGVPADDAYRKPRLSWTACIATRVVHNAVLEACMMPEKLHSAAVPTLLESWNTVARSGTLHAPAARGGASCCTGRQPVAAACSCTQAGASRMGPPYRPLRRPRRLAAPAPRGPDTASRHPVPSGKDARTGCTVALCAQMGAREYAPAMLAGTQGGGWRRRRRRGLPPTGRRPPRMQAAPDDGEGG